MDAKYKGAVEKIVRERNGSADDVTFVLHHTLVGFMKQVMENRDLVIDGNLYSYLNGIAKYVWLGELRRKKRVASKETVLEFESHDTADMSFELLILDEERNEAISTILDIIGEKCKQVLMLWAGGYNMKEIAEQSGYKSEGVARKKKFQCMKSLTAYLDQNPEQKEMLR